MPRNKKGYAASKKVWILYSSNRQFCFLHEIGRGYWGPHYKCGCIKCDPHLLLPEPAFISRPGETSKVVRKD